MPNWLYLVLTVPTVSAFIGWLTNWQAVKMIFWPPTPRGWGPLRWQAIIYHHADKFATNLGNIAERDLMNGKDLAGKLDAEAIEREFGPLLDAEVPALVAEAADKLMPGAWAKVPAPMQAMIVEQVKTRTRAVSKDVTAEIQRIIGESIDVKTLVHGQLSGSNVDRLARLTKEIGRKEFFFIEWSGGLFGALIGFGQIFVWDAFQIWWIMPIFGVIVGLITNWLALQMIFRPYERKRYLGLFPYQGLFPKRQPEIARDYGRTTATEILTAHNVIESLVTGARGAHLDRELRRVLSERIDREWDQVKGLVPLPVSAEQLATLKDLIADRMLVLAVRLRPQVEKLLDDKLEVRQTVERRLGGLSKPEFERMLRGVFQEDELTLIIIGGVLGGAVGALQAALVLAGVG